MNRIFAVLGTECRDATQRRNGRIDIASASSSPTSPQEVSVGLRLGGGLL